MPENTTITRRQNLLALYQAYAQEQLAGGASAKGLEQAFAATMEISPSLWSQIKSSRPIGDKLARQIERHLGKPAEWLDSPHAQDARTPDDAEERFVEQARQAWRKADAKGKRRLKRFLLKPWPSPDDPE